MVLPRDPHSMLDAMRAAVSAGITLPTDHIIAIAVQWFAERYRSERGSTSCSRIICGGPGADELLSIVSIVDTDARATSQQEICIKIMDDEAQIWDDALTDGPPPSTRDLMFAIKITTSMAEHKQLILTRSLSSSVATLCPILEPVKATSNELRDSIQAIQSKGQHALLKNLGSGSPLND